MADQGNRRASNPIPIIPMPLRPDGVKEPSLWLGTWSLCGEGWGPSDARQARQVLERALDSGIGHLDTAGFYGHGGAERLVAKAISGCRERVFISTKGGLVWEGRQVHHRGRPEDLYQALCESMDRLKVDRIDLFQIHWPDPRVPLQESLDALVSFREQGLIRYWGVGNLSSEQVRGHLPNGGLVPHQVHYNPIHAHTSQVLEEGHHRAATLNLIVSPLEQGLLADSRAAQGLGSLGKKDQRRRNPHFKSAQVGQWVQRYRELTATLPISRATLILCWLLERHFVDVVIPGPRTLAQLDQIFKVRHARDTAREILANNASLKSHLDGTVQE